LTFAQRGLELLDYSNNRNNFLCTLVRWHSLHYTFHQDYANNMVQNKEFSVNKLTWCGIEMMESTSQIVKWYFVNCEGNKFCVRKVLV
jgi:hypothetical protein